MSDTTLTVRVARVLLKPLSAAASHIHLIAKPHVISAKASLDSLIHKFLEYGLARIGTSPPSAPEFA